MPSAVASWVSLGSTSTVPSGVTATASAAAAPYCTSSCAATGSVSAVTTWCGWPLRCRKFCSRSTEAEPDAPMSVAPLAPAWISETRRRISARMMRSPRSASAMISARSCSGTTRMPSTSPTHCASTSAAPPYSVPASARNSPGW